MGHRTLSMRLVLRALFLDPAAYDAMRDDDNPFIEGAFLIVLVGVATALLNLIGQVLAWATTPNIDAVKQIVLNAYRQMPWFNSIANNPQALAQFNRYWDLGWQIFPRLFGAPDPASAALNILAWPVVALLAWLIYGLLVFLFARLLRGTGTLNQTLGTTALAVTPLLLRGFGLIPFLTIGALLNTWQLLCRYRAVRSVHRLSVGRAAWATILPFAVYLLFWLVVGGFGVLILSALARR
jgi:hypothetical protein